MRSKNRSCFILLTIKYTVWLFYNCNSKLYKYQSMQIFTPDVKYTSRESHCRKFIALIFIYVHNKWTNLINSASHKWSVILCAWITYICGSHFIKSPSSIDLAHHVSCVNSLNNMRCRFNKILHAFVKIIEKINFDCYIW